MNLASTVKLKFETITRDVQALRLREKMCEKALVVREIGEAPRTKRRRLRAIKNNKQIEPIFSKMSCLFVSPAA